MYNYGKLLYNMYGGHKLDQLGVQRSHVTLILNGAVQTFTFPHGRSPHYTNVYTFTRRVLCQISSATKLTM